MRIPGPTPAQQARFAAALDALHPRGPLILAVSGGPDSLALLLLAAATRPGAIVAATVDHRLRPEAADEARFVHDLCQRFGVHHRILAAKVARDDGQGVQAAARAARYDALVWYARRKEAAAIATAHHVDDQAETVLMRLGRGAGVAGLAGVRERRPIADGVAAVRPLLGWRRSELAAIVAAAGLAAVDDPSNQDPRYDRTRVRALLAQGWPDPARVAAVARHMRDADDALDWSAGRLFADRFRRDAATGDSQLDVAGLPREYLRRLAILAMAAAAPDGAVPRGDELVRLLDRLEAGHVSTLGTLQITPAQIRPAQIGSAVVGEGAETAAIWRFATVPPHRSA